MDRIDSVHGGRPWDFLTRLGSRKPHSSGAVLARQGAPARDVFLIVNGFVKITMADEEGRDWVVDVHSPGDEVGLCVGFLGVPYPFTAKALTDGVSWHVRAADLQRAISESPALSHSLHTAQCREILAHRTRLAVEPRRTARRRFEDLLAHIGRHQAGAAQDSLTVRLPLKQWELAEFLAVTPAHLTRMLQAMEREGTLRRKPGSIFVLTKP